MNSDQVALLRKAEQSLRSARLLANQGRYDLASARSHDVMFHVAEAFLAGQSLTFSRRPAIAAAFREQYDETGLIPSELQHYLTQALDAQPAGQDDVKPIARNDALDHIAHAQQFLDLSRRLLGPVPAVDGEEESA